MEQEEIIPSHTRAFTAEKRALYADYVAAHEGTQSSSNSHVIQSSGRNNNLIVDYGRGRSFAFINPAAASNTVQLHKRTCNFSNVIKNNYKFGRYYELLDKKGNIQLKLEQSREETEEQEEGEQEKNENQQEEELPEEDTPATSTNINIISANNSSSVYSDPNFLPTTNNANLFDNNKSQKLDSNTIESLKRSGNTKELISNLVANSATFHQKTEFSQEKYIKKKKRKYLADIQLIQANAKNVIQTYYDRDPNKIGLMRLDTIALIISSAAIRNDCRTIICDSNYSGLITATAAGKISDQGAVLHAFAQNNWTNPSQVPRLEAVVRSNLTEQQQKSIYYAPLHNLLQVNSGAAQPFSAEIDVLLQGKFDSIVIALPNVNLKQLLSNLWPLLRDSGIFVIYSHYLAVLSELYYELRGLDSITEKNSIHCCGLNLFESWYRAYQVLPNRTHPNVNMTSSSGYILMGYKTVRQ
jgi:tRNA (adenine-N(1)-)-methyltransferase non-catalytic subunit